MQRKRWQEDGGECHGRGDRNSETQQQEAEEREDRRDVADEREVEERAVSGRRIDGGADEGKRNPPLVERFVVLHPRGISRVTRVSPAQLR